MRWLLFIISCIIAYFLGAIPTAYLFGKWKKGIDIREHGSGNVGATNVFRVMGRVAGLLVLLVDVTKGGLAVTLLPNMIQPNSPVEPDWFLGILGMLAIAGHVWTPFLKFNGGKGVATSLGVFLFLDTFSALIALAVWIATLLLCRYVSISSMVASVTLTLVMALSLRPFPLVLIASISCLVICYRHESNIRKLLLGSEKKIGQKD